MYVKRKKKIEKMSAFKWKVEESANERSEIVEESAFVADEEESMKGFVVPEFESIGAMGRDEVDAKYNNNNNNKLLMKEETTTTTSYAVQENFADRVMNEQSIVSNATSVHPDTATSSSTNTASASIHKRVSSGQSPINNFSGRLELPAKVRQFVHQDGSSDAIETMEQMLNDGTIPSVDVQDSSYSYRTALHHQTVEGTKEAMEWLLTRRPSPADVNMKDDDGYTALLLAIAFSSNNKSNVTEKVQLLLEYGADRRITTKEGRTPLSRAKLTRKDPTMIEMLQSFHPDVSVEAIETRRVLFEEKRHAKRLAANERQLKEQSAKQGTLSKRVSTLLGLKILLGMSSGWEDSFIYCDDSALLQFQEKTRPEGLEPIDLDSSRPEMKFTLCNCTVEKTSHIYSTPFTFTITDIKADNLSSITLSAKNEEDYLMWLNHLEKFCCKTTKEPSDSAIPLKVTSLRLSPTCDLNGVKSDQRNDSFVSDSSDIIESNTSKSGGGAGGGWGKNEQQGKTSTPFETFAIASTEEEMLRRGNTL